MAAAVSSSVWGAKSKPGAWALEAEQHEEELQSSAPSALHPEPPSADFPTLADAAASKTKKKKKPQTLSLAEFSTFKPSAFKSSAADEPIALPTGPRERSAEELERSRSGFGGGFRSYGYDSANPRSRVSERSDGWDRADEGLSRADEADDWSKAKKFTGASGGDGREKLGFFNSSRADEVDNWASKKTFAPTVTEGRREGRRGFETSSNGVDSDSWTRTKGGRDGSAGFGGPRLGFESSGAADSDNWLKKKESNGGSVTAGRPRISLQPRTLPITNHTNGGVEVKPSPKGSNPFGDARPREEVLKEKGKDWKEIDEKLGVFNVKEEPAKEANPWRRNDGLMGKKSWRKDDTETATQPAVSMDDQVGKGDDEDETSKDITQNGDAEIN